MTAGARQRRACEVIGVDERSLQRWRRQDIGEDRRAGPKSSPISKLTEHEEQRILEIVRSPRFRDLSPKQIVPMLADDGVFVASESSFYRVLRRAGQLAHRGRAKPPTSRRPDEYVATAPNQVWCWDITYLPTLVRGQFFYCYTILDVFSRKIVGYAVHDRESDLHAAVLIAATCAIEGVEPGQLVVHSDNGHPMRGATMLATMQQLGVAASFSRPAVSDDNPFVEAVFRTMKYRPEYPSLPFASIDAAARWVRDFVAWYNNRHLHSSIGFVTPQQRHTGADRPMLMARAQVYAAARRQHPHRWSGACRSWKHIHAVRLNPRTTAAAEAVA